MEVVKFFLLFYSIVLIIFSENLSNCFNQFLVTFLFAPVSTNQNPYKFVRNIQDGS